jgi:hypothetical protein
MALARLGALAAAVAATAACGFTTHQVIAHRAVD